MTDDECIARAERHVAQIYLRGDFPPADIADEDPFGAILVYLAYRFPERGPHWGPKGIVHGDKTVTALLKRSCDVFRKAIHDRSHSFSLPGNEGKIAKAVDKLSGIAEDAREYVARLEADEGVLSGRYDSAIKATRDLANVIDIVLAETGDRQAAYRLIALAEEGDLVQRRPCLPFAVGLRAMLGHKDGLGRFNGINPLGVVGRALWAGHRALSRPLRGLADAAALDEGTGWPVDGDRAGIVRDRIAEPEAPTLVVVPYLGHLLGRAGDKSSVARSHTPLAQYGHLAEKALPLVQAPDPAAFQATLDAEFPWYRDVTAILARHLARGRYVKLPNILLHGGVGTAKTSYARRALELTGLRTTLHAVAGANDSMWGSVSQAWSTGKVSLPLALIAQAMQGTVGIVLDELDKLPPPGTGGQNGRFDEVILPFLEATSSKAMLDTYLEASVNLSAVTYLATANDVRKVGSVLRDRFQCIAAPVPRVEDLPVIVRQMQVELLEEQGFDARWLVPFGQDQIDLLASQWRPGSLRGLRRMVEILLDGQAVGTLN